MKPSERERVKTAGRRMYEGGLVAGAVGAIGVRLSSGDVVVTARGSRLGFLEPSDMVTLNDNGLPCDGSAVPPAIDASLLFAVLSAQGEAGSVIRVQSPYATALAHRGHRALEKSMALLEHLGGVAFVPHYRPGTAGLAGAVADVLRANRVAIIEGQGPVLWGRDIDDAVDQAEVLEAAAKVIFLLDGRNGAGSG